MIDAATSENMMEREYYFDEGLGQSLNEHTKQLHDQFPSMNIDTRRDRDGLPIVKLTLKYQFKYDIDEIMNVDPEKMKQI